MGLLSKIFDTDKLEYILREEEFSVTAPKQWNVETLTVGDTITPDMFKDQYRFYDFDLYIKEIGYDDEYEYDDDMEGDFYVTTEFDNSAKKYLHNQHTWWFHEINDYLKPEYKVVTADLSESEDEFNVDAPEDWNIEQLSKGDIITPDMWDKKKTMGISNTEIKFDETYKISKVYTVEDWWDEVDENWFPAYEAYLIDSQGVEAIDYLDNINMWLKPEFKVVKPLFESEDEFNVNAPKEWDVTELGVGDIITNDMWNPNTTKGKHFFDWIAFEEDGWEIIGIENDQVGDDRFYVTIMGVDSKLDFSDWLDKFNDYLKRQYKIADSLNESEDDFTVDAPESWNVTELGVGDYITPEMIDTPKDRRRWTSFHKVFGDPKRAPGWKIVEFVIDYVRLEHNGVKDIFSIKSLNKKIKPQFKIVPPTNETKLSSLLEQDDDFNVTAPTEWNIEYLSVGDIITPDMWQDKVEETFADFKQGKLFKKLITKPVKIDHVLEGDNIYFTVEGVDPVFTNDVLLPQYQVVKDKYVFESEDEFNVDAPTEWNVTELSKGDIITPDMWNDDINWTHDIRIEGFKPFSDENGYMIYLKHLDSSRFSMPQVFTLSEVNSWLKNTYRVEVNGLMESDEDDFSVEAPQEWNVKELGVGDKITYDMVKPNGNLWHRSPELLPILIKTQGDENYFVRYSNGAGYWYSPNKINNRLKSEYKVFESLSESDEEDFSVEASPEWNVEYLTAGDTITPEMWDVSKLATQLKYYFKKPVQISWIGYSEFDDEEEELLVNIYLGGSSMDFDINNLNDLLKPEFKVVNKKDLFEEEDFNVDAPAEWNQHELKVGDYFNEYTEKVYTHKEDIPENEKNFTYEVIYIGPNEGEYHKPAYFDHNIIVFKSLRTKNIFSFTVQHFNDTRGPILNAYINLPNKMSDLNESDDEDFSVEAPPEWNQESLSTGDVITPNMWDKQKFINEPDLNGIKVYNEAIEDSWVIESIYYAEEDGTWFVFLKSSTADHKYFGLWSDPEELDNINNVLKDNYKIYIPNTLLESDDEEDFSVDAPENWDVEELGIGSILDPSNLKMQNYSKKYEIIDFKKSVWGNDVIVKVFELVEEPIPGTIRTTRQWKHTKNSSINLKTLNDYLKDNYKIISTLSESDDEFSVDAPSEWSVEYLTVGDIVTSDMFQDLDQAKRSYGSSKKFKIIDIWVSTTGSLIVRLKTSSWKLSDLLVNDDFLLKHFNEDLKPQYKVVPPNKIFESDDDEFNVEAPKSWDQHELKVGDYFNEYDEKVYTHKEDIPGGIFKSSTYEVIYIGPNEGEYYNPNYYDNNIIVFRSTYGKKNTYSFTVDYFNESRGLKLNAYINYPDKMPNLNESDDDWTVDEPSPEWNVEYLGVGDTIQGKMWNWKNIINWCNRVAGDNHVELNELIRRWEDVYDEGVTIDRIVKYGDYHHVEFDSDSGFLRFGPNVSTVNNWLSDGYEIEKSLTEEAEDFNVMASPKWDVIELGVGDYINSNMLNPKGNDYTWFSRRKFFIEDIYFDECWTVKLTHVESEHDEEMCVDFLNSDVLNDKYKIMTSLNELLEVDDEFDVEAPKEWDVEELGIGDKITRDMIKNPDFLDQMDEDFRMDFPGVITKIYKAGPTDDDQYWGVRIKFQDVGWRKYLPKSENIKLGLGFSLDGFNQNTLKPQYQIKEPVFELSKLLENEEDFNVNAPDEWNVELLTVGDTITPDMWGYDGIFFDVSKPLTIEDIGEDEGGWWIQLGRSEAPFDLDEINEYLKSKYRVVPYILEESDDEFSVNAPKEWNITQLGVNDVITPDMWSKKGIKTSLIINKIEKRGIIAGNEWWEIHMKPYGSKPLQNNEKSSIIWDFDDVQNHLKPEYKIIKNKVIFEEEDFNVNAPEEWNEEYWEDYGGIEEDVYSSFQNFVYRVLKKREIEDEFIETYLDEIFNYGDISDYINISSSKLIDDFNVWVDAQDSDSDWYVDMNESDDDFNVSAPEEWWEYDGDVEIMFQDTYWYEDENGKEAIVERDGGGILNINDLEQYSYSGWKPFTGNPTSENLTKWYYSIDWDTDLIEIFSFDDSIFEVEEDFEWSSAENVDMDRTGFRIRAVSTLKEVEDEFTVKPSKKWDIVYLNKGDFLDNTNSTFNDPNVKYEIGNITSDGEIEVKKYINRGNGFEPQFDRFMKTRKGIVKAKLKPGFDIETSSK